jgi:hypothetical protein
MARVSQLEALQVAVMQGAVEHAKKVQTFELREAEAKARKAETELETAELIREHVRKHGAGLSDFPGLKGAAS